MSQRGDRLRLVGQLSEAEGGMVCSFLTADAKDAERLVAHPRRRRSPRLIKQARDACLLSQPGVRVRLSTGDARPAVNS